MPIVRWPNVTDSIRSIAVQARRNQNRARSFAYTFHTYLNNHDHCFHPVPEFSGVMRLPHDPNCPACERPGFWFEHWGKVEI